MVCHGVQDRGDLEPLFVGDVKNKTKTFLLVYEHHSSVFGFFPSG